MSVSEASQSISSSISAWTFSRILRSAYPREARRPARTSGAHLSTMIPLESMKWERWLSSTTGCSTDLNPSRESLSASRSTS